MSLQVNETEYTEFYKSTFRAYDEPMAKTHFSLEGQVEFKALLYIPSVVSRDSDAALKYVLTSVYHVTFILVLLESIHAHAKSATALGSA